MTTFPAILPAPFLVLVISEMVKMILDGCKDIEEAKEKLAKLLAEKTED